MPDKVQHGNWIGSLDKGGDDAFMARMQAEEPNLDGPYDQNLRCKIVEFEGLRAHHADIAAKSDQRGRAIAEEAILTINGERQDAYGNPEDNFSQIAQLWSAYLGAHISPLNVAHMMCLLKIARAKSGKGTKDCYVDLLGYAMLGASMRGYDA